MKHHPQLPRKARGPIIISGLTAAAVSTGLLSWGLFQQYPPTGWYQDQSFIASWDWLKGLLDAHTPSGSYRDALTQWLLHGKEISKGLVTTLTQYDLTRELGSRFAVIGFGGCLAGAVGAYHCSRHLEAKTNLKHVRGRQFFKGKTAIQKARKAAKGEIKRTGRGIEIAPKVYMSLDAETRHMLLVGASGSGKTQTLQYIIPQLLERGDRMVLHDTKGDMTATLPTDECILLAPHGKSSYAWDIAKDTIGLAAARELASRLIQNTGSDPTWTNGATEILTGLVRWLQKEYETNWTWADLQNLAFSDMRQIRTMLLQAYPEAAGFVEVDEETGTPNKTSYSYLVTFWSHIGQVVSPLAMAWSDTPEEKRISLTEWLANEETDKRVLILQRSAEYAALSKAWIGAAVQLMANFASSPALSESRSRRIWLMLDEFAQMGKLEGFQQFLEVGRSRGIRCVLGLQDLEQLSDLYGQEALKTWLNTIETKIICRMNAGPSANFIAKDLIGEREVSWEEESLSSPQTGFFADKENMPSKSYQVRTDMVPILMPSELESELGPQTIEGETRIRALLLGRGNLYQLDWPLTIWPNRRPATEPADWLKS